MRRRTWWKMITTKRVVKPSSSVVERVKPTASKRRLSKKGEGPGERREARTDHAVQDDAELGIVLSVNEAS